MYGLFHLLHAVVCLGLIHLCIQSIDVFVVLGTFTLFDVVVRVGFLYILCAICKHHVRMMQYNCPTLPCALVF